MSRRERTREAVKRYKKTLDERRKRTAGRATKAAEVAAARLASGFEDAPEPDEERTKALGRRAERAGEARAPVKSSLALTSDPRDIESFAAAGMTVDAGQTQPHSEPADDGVMLGDPMQVGDAPVADEADGESPLDFADPFGVGGGDGEADDGGGRSLL